MLQIVVLIGKNIGDEWPMGTALSSITIILLYIIFFPNLFLVYKIAIKWEVINIRATGDGIIYISHPSRLALQHAFAIAYKANN